MEAAWKAPVSVMNCSSTLSHHLNSVKTRISECRLAGELGRQHLACKTKTISLKRLKSIKRGGQLWSLDFHSEGTAGVEDSLPNKSNTDVRKVPVEMAANDGHRSNLNGFPIDSKDVDKGDAVNGDVANEVCHTFSGDASCPVVYTSVHGVSRKGSTNGSTVRKTSRTDSANGRATFSGVSPLNGSTNGSVGNGDSICAGQGDAVNVRSTYGTLLNGSSVKHLSKNGTLNEYSKTTSADNSVTKVPELERLVQAPLNAPSEQVDNEAAVDRVHQLEDPLVLALGLTPVKPETTATVANDVGQRVGNAAVEKFRDAGAGGGLGIVEFLKGKNLLVTGATGFLAKGTNSRI